ncbi:MAG TPA: DUF58 domain-containing protein [Candidatus Gallacutalibacter stercoravium]|nr:DUF58 domain-containing protein [Candidatus Gallacutalibacter stercoravium]
MKKLLFLLLIALTWYLAAMYHLLSLMVLAVAELLLWLGMFVLSRYFKRHISAGFPGEWVVVQKGQKTPCPFALQNTGRLPGGRIRIRFSWAYWNMAGEKSGYLYGGVEGGKQTPPQFYLNAPWCGMLTVGIASAQAYDYLSLFHARLKAKGELRVAVLPQGEAVKVALSRGFGDQPGWEEEAFGAAGNGGGEVRQLREYAAGDSYRQIHWNQTARMDELWVKERQPEQERAVFVYLDLRSSKRREAKELNAFFEVLFALTAGLLQARLCAHILWKEPGGVSVGMAVNSMEDCRAMLLRLYQSASIPDGNSEDFAEKETGLCLDLKLTLYEKGRLVFRFSQENYQEELKQLVLIL